MSRLFSPIKLSGHKWRRPFYPGQLTHGLIFRIFVSDFPGQRKNDQDTDNTGTSIVAGKTGIEPVTQGLTVLRSAAELLSRNGH